MRYRCISVLEEYICMQDYTPFGGPAWGLPVKMLNIFTPKARGLLGSGSPGPCGPNRKGTAAWFVECSFADDEYHSEQDYKNGAEQVKEQAEPQGDAQHVEEGGSGTWLHAGSTAQNKRYTRSMLQLRYGSEKRMRSPRPTLPWTRT
jgi:hypothetical protein